MFKSLASLLDLVPADYFPADGNWTDLKRELANKRLEGAVEHPGRFRFLVVQSDRCPEGRYKGAIRVGGELDSLKSVPCKIWAYFNEDQAEAVARLNINDSVVISGQITYCKINENGLLIVNLFESHIGDR